jgi:c-di-GMP-binding flagellar brake protein YcgR
VTVQLDQGDALLLSPGHPLQVCWGSARGMNRMTANGAPEGDVMRLTPAADISEGGARLLFVGVVPDIVVGKPVRVKVQLPGGPVLDGAAEVVRMFKLRHHTFEVAVRFVGMPERAADQLRQFLFSRQLEMGVASLN